MLFRSPHVSSGELMSGCDTPGGSHPGSQEDVVGNWETAHSWVGDAVSGAEIAAAPCLLALAVEKLSLCLPAGEGPKKIRHPVGDMMGDGSKV